MLLVAGLLVLWTVAAFAAILLCAAARHGAGRAPTPRPVVVLRVVGGRASRHTRAG